jgi:hypothetical protein
MFKATPWIPRSFIRLNYGLMTKMLSMCLCNPYSQPSFHCAMFLSLSVDPEEGSDMFMPEGGWFFNKLQVTLHPKIRKYVRKTLSDCVLRGRRRGDVQSRKLFDLKVSEQPSRISGTDSAICFIVLPFFLQYLTNAENLICSWSITSGPTLMIPNNFIYVRT